MRTNDMYVANESIQNIQNIQNILNTYNILNIQTIQNIQNTQKQKLLIRNIIVWGHLPASYI